jgi:SNARE protein
MTSRGDMRVHACCLGCCVAQTAATLHDQTQQLNKVVDDLNEIEFTMKKASKVIADIGKGIMTDR